MITFGWISLKMSVIELTKRGIFSVLFNIDETRDKKRKQTQIKKNEKTKMVTGEKKIYVIKMHKK